VRLSKGNQRFVIALIVLLLYGGALIILSLVGIEDKNRDAVLQLVGGIVTLAAMAFGYYFGKSVGDDGRGEE
jgi:hypothetical protein